MGRTAVMAVEAQHPRPPDAGVCGGCGLCFAGWAVRTSARGGGAALEVDADEEVVRDELAPLAPQHLDPDRVDRRRERAEHLQVSWGWVSQD